MNWTTEKPTAVGQYWVTVKRWFDTVPFVDCVGVGRDGDKIILDWNVDGFEWDASFELADITHWMGPLPFPDLPHD